MNRMTTDTRTSDAADTGIGDAGGDGDGAVTSTDAAAALGRSEERRALAVRAAVARRAVRDVPSPCISVCKMNEDRSLCTGCWRSLDEIRAWSAADGATRRGIWRTLMDRAGLVAP